MPFLSLCSISRITSKKVGRLRQIEFSVKRFLTGSTSGFSRDYQTSIYVGLSYSIHSQIPRGDRIFAIEPTEDSFLRTGTPNFGSVWF